MSSLTSKIKSSICVLCLEHLLDDRYDDLNEESSRENHRQSFAQFTQFTTAYLKVERGESLLTDHHHPEAGFCEECEQHVKSILKLHMQLEELKCKLAWKVATVAATINKSQRRMEATSAQSHIPWSTPNSTAEIGVDNNSHELSEFRKQLATKCGLMANRILPNVMLAECNNEQCQSPEWKPDAPEVLKSEFQNPDSPETCVEKIEVDIPSPDSSTVSFGFEEDELTAANAEPSTKNCSTPRDATPPTLDVRSKIKRNRLNRKNERRNAKPRKLYPEPSAKCFRRLRNPLKNKAKTTTAVADVDLEPHSFSIKCTDCTMTFRKLFPFHEHIQKEHSKRAAEAEDNHRCDICHQQFESSLALLSHLQETHETDEKSKFCILCSKSFTTEQCCELHRKNVHWLFPQQLHCEVNECLESFTSTEKLEQHYKTIHFSDSPRPAIPDNHLFSCDKCRWSFLSKERLLLHQLAHFSPNSTGSGYKCPKCPNHYRTTMKLAGHYNLVVVPYHINPAHRLKIWDCDADRNCDFYFFSEKELTSHKERHEHYQLSCNFRATALCRKGAKRDRPGVCLYCLQKFPSQELRIAHESRCPSKPSREEGASGQLRCQQCGYTTKRRNQMQVHMRVHRNVRVECPICGGKYSRKDHLQEHIARRHAGLEKKFVCHICGAKRTLEMELKYHMAEHEKKHLCQECGETFPRATTLKVHMRKHSGERLQCEWCPKLYMDKSGLRYHYNTEHAEEYQKWYVENVRKKLICRVAKQEGDTITTANTGGKKRQKK